MDVECDNNSDKSIFDWYCIKCGGQNFKKRFRCYKCKAPRNDSEKIGSGKDEMCLHATKTIMLRNLDTITTEHTVRDTLSALHPSLSPSITEIYISREASASRGVCYLGMDTLDDSRALYGALNASPTPLSFDGRDVTVSFCRYHVGDRRRAYVDTGVATLTKGQANAPPSADALNNLAVYSAMQYARNQEEYARYLEYYKNYYKEQMNVCNSTVVCRMGEVSQMDATNAAAAVAHAAMQKVNASKKIP